MTTGVIVTMEIDHGALTLDFHSTIIRFDFSHHTINIQYREFGIVVEISYIQCVGTGRQFIIVSSFYAIQTTFNFTEIGKWSL
jgi:hypothetical protein